MENLLRNLFTAQNQSFNLLEGITLFLIFAWSIIWKGTALWHAAQSREKIWFALVLVANTAGILEILYLFLFSKEKLSIKNVQDKLKDLLRRNF